jgi:hypoxanthine phosphoribosyltransferase
VSVPSDIQMPRSTSANPRYIGFRVTRNTPPVTKEVEGKIVAVIDEIADTGETLRLVAAKDQVLLIDLARELPRHSVYYYDYLHYTEAGAAAVAEIIYRDLRPFVASHFAGCAG